jgi:acyl carrier protein
VTPEASFMDDLGADSLDTVELILAFEDELDVLTPADEADKVGTVKDVTDYIEAKKAA